VLHYEELQSAHEEILSSNEEFQSINEELETAKEELQSTNEELVTLNDELNDRNRELHRLNDDLDNFVASAALPLLILGRDLTLRRFTPMAARVLNLIPADIDRPLLRLRMGIDAAELQDLIVKVLDSMTPAERELRDHQDHWWRLQVSPFRTRENQI